MICICSFSFPCSEPDASRAVWELSLPCCNMVSCSVGGQPESSDERMLSAIRRWFCCNNGKRPTPAGCQAILVGVVCVKQIQTVWNYGFKRKLQCLRRFGTNWCWIYRCGKDQQLLVLDLRPRTLIGVWCCGVGFIFLTEAMTRLAANGWEHSEIRCSSLVFSDCVAQIWNQEVIALILCKLPIVLC